MLYYLAVKVQGSAAGDGQEEAITWPYHVRLPAPDSRSPKVQGGAAGDGEEEAVRAAGD